MKLLKVSSISFFVFLSLLLVTPAFAAVTPVPKFSHEAVVVVDINIHNTKIVSQDGNLIKLSFDVQNGEGAQAGLKYSVSLIKDTPNGQFTYDEYIYPEELSIAPNITIKKEITYVAPSNLTGEYMLLVTVKNESGLILGLGIPGKIKVTATVKTIELSPETCFLSVVGEKGSPKYSTSQGVDIDPKEQLTLTCTALNSSKVTAISTPVYETRYRTTLGEVVATEGGNTTPISFKAGEKKSITLSLPKAAKPQAYVVKVSLNSSGMISNPIVVHYVVRGFSSTIQNFSLDKDSYKNGDTAKLSFFWSPSADIFPGSRGGTRLMSNIFLSVNITNDKQKNCIVPLNQIVNKNGLMEISVPIISDCNNPKASLELKDAQGGVLDNKELTFISNALSIESKKSNTLYIAIIFGILIVVGFAVYFINLKKKGYAEHNLSKENEKISQ